MGVGVSTICMKVVEAARIQVGACAKNFVALKEDLIVLVENLTAFVVEATETDLVADLLADLESSPSKYMHLSFSLSMLT